MSWCETEMQKYNMPLVKQNVIKFEVFILGGQRIDQKRNKGWGRGSRERIEMEAKKVTDIGSKCPGISGTVPDLLTLSLVPEGLPICPGRSLISS